MRYSEFQTYIEGDEKLLEGLAKKLKNCRRNSIIQELIDYYVGNQWSLDKSTNETRHTRSGKEMWKKFGKNSNRGFTAGELKVWNMCKLAVDTLATYARGDSRDDVQLTVKLNGNIDKPATKQVGLLFDDINNFVIQSVKRMAVTSILPLKYDSLLEINSDDVKENEKEVMKTIRMQDNDYNGVVEMLDSREIEPIYWKGFMRGIIRFYYITKDEAKRRFNITAKAEKYLYMEFVWVDGDGAVKRREAVNDQWVAEIEDNPYEFINYKIQANAKNSFSDFDLDNLEDSDVMDLIELQDDINAFLTDLNTIYRKVALPMLKATDEFIKNAKDKDITKVKKLLERVSTQAGSILFAPVERLEGGRIDPGQVQYLQDVLEQFHRQTGIPKSIFNSEGLANIASETLDNLFQSMKIRVGEKRTNVTSAFRSVGEMHLRYTGDWKDGMEVEVDYPDMFTMNKKILFTLITDALKNKFLPKKYGSSKIISLLGDGEDTQEILAQLSEEDAVFKLELENSMAQARIQNSGNEVIQRITQRTEERNRDNQELNRNVSE